MSFLVTIETTQASLYQLSTLCKSSKATTLESHENNSQACNIDQLNTRSGRNQTVRTCRNKTSRNRASPEHRNIKSPASCSRLAQDAVLLADLRGELQTDKQEGIVHEDHAQHRSDGTIEASDRNSFKWRSEGRNHHIVMAAAVVLHFLQTQGHVGVAIIIAEHI